MEGNGNGKPLGREAFLAAVGKLDREMIHVPELGGDVLLQELMSAEREAFEAEIITGKGKDLDVVLRGLKGKLIVRSVVDETGARVLGDEDREAILDQLGARTINRIFTACQKLNGLSDADVRETAGNSVSVPSVDSSSA